MDEYACIPSRELCVSGLEMIDGGISAMEDAIRKFFSEFGTVDFVKVPEEIALAGYPTIALVRFVHIESAKKACADFYKIFPGQRKMKVQYSVHLKTLPDKKDVSEADLEESFRNIRTRSVTPCVS